MSVSPTTDYRIRYLIEKNGFTYLVQKKFRIPPPYPYGHPLGPSGNAPKTFGHCGSGNQSGFRGGGHKESEGDPLIASLAQDFVLRDGYSVESVCPPRLSQQERDWRNNDRRWRRIRANGKKRPVGRPRRDLSAEQEQRARELLQAGWGINRIAKELGIGNDAVSRLKDALS